MKTLSTAFKLLLAAAIVGGAASCSDKSAATADTPAETAEAPAALKIAYVDADSVMSAYLLAQELNAEGQRAMNELQRQANVKDQQLTALAQSIEQKRQNNTYMSQMSFEADVNDLQRRQGEAQQQLAAQQAQLQNNIMLAQKRINDSVQSAVAEFNRIYNYDAILMKEAGVYFSPALDVTPQIIQILNSRYTPATTAQ